MLYNMCWCKSGKKYSSPTSSYSVFSTVSTALEANRFTFSIDELQGVATHHNTEHLSPTDFLHLLH